ncbi:hypothetical protein ALC53_13616 [Atta colombica]|uniref:Uncharacterized protein n=1 Tax=Atta colombica TaxID=520822 RepID=A0A195AUI9_9HYME|nr:hypothetical protein ALC53_13616 [Atta colombica]
MISLQVFYSQHIDVNPWRLEQSPCQWVPDSGLIFPEWFIRSGHQIYRCVVISRLSVQSESRTILIYAVETIALMKFLPRTARHG